MQLMMKTIHFEIPTMTGPQKQQEVSYSLKRPGVFDIITESGKAAVICADDLPKVEMIIAIEEAGHVVRY